jgi:HD-GYP domain-containing protein (c-di-GMP phosphodiesterase class II)
MGLDESQRRTIHFGGLLHDIGKIRIDPAVLASADASQASRAELERHPTHGLEILHSITAWEDVLPVVHAHHERWDGKGYPRGLSGDDIPLGARIVSVAEAFDAMTRDTPHGKRKTSAEALRELETCAGSQFDARVVRIFVAEFEKHGHPLESDA